MKKRESTNWYSVIKKSYFKKIGYKENEKIALLIMIMVPYMFYAMMLAYGLHVEILFIQLYAYFSICFIMAIIFFITWLDSKNEVVSEENKSLAMKKA